MSIPTEAIEAAARAIYDVSGAKGSFMRAGRSTQNFYRDYAHVALTAAAPFIAAPYIQAAAVAEASAYLERIHPSGLTPTKAVLADLAVVEHRMGHGRHANGNDRITP